MLGLQCQLGSTHGHPNTHNCTRPEAALGTFLLARDHDRETGIRGIINPYSEVDSEDHGRYTMSPMRVNRATGWLLKVRWIWLESRTSFPSYRTSLL